MQSYEFLKAWRERAKALQPKVPGPGALPDQAAFEGALLSGEPLVTLVSPVFEPALFADTVGELADLLHKFRGDEAPAKLAAAVRGADTGARQALVSAVTGQGTLGDWADAHGVDSGLLTTLCSLALQPFMARFAQAVTAEAPIAMWRQNYCPCCGSSPDVCRIDPDNLRFLHCPQCDTQWEHHRLTCAICDTDDIKQVRLLTVETLEPWRVECCDNCGGYIKTLDQRHGGQLAMPKVDLYLEDARTLGLNVLAEQEGFRQGGRVQ